MKRVIALFVIVLSMVYALQVWKDQESKKQLEEMNTHQAIGAKNAVENNQTKTE